MEAFIPLPAELFCGEANYVVPLLVDAWRVSFVHSLPLKMVWLSTYCLYSLVSQDAIPILNLADIHLGVQPFYAFFMGRSSEGILILLATL